MLADARGLRPAPHKTGHLFCHCQFYCCGLLLIDMSTSGFLFLFLFDRDHDCNPCWTALRLFSHVEDAFALLHQTHFVFSHHPISPTIP